MWREGPSLPVSGTVVYPKPSAPHLISNRDSFKSDGQLARELQRWYLMSFSSFSKTLI